MWVLRARWTDGPDSSWANADLLHSWLAAFEQVDPEVRIWYRGSIEPDADRVPILDWRELLDRGLISPGLGSVVAAWAADHDDGYSLTLHCGSQNAAVPNQLILQIPEARCRNVVRLGAADQLLAATARYWHPNFATVSNSELWGDIPQDASGFSPGWLTFLPFNSPLAASAERTGWRTEPVDSIGRIYIAADSPDYVSRDILEKWNKP
jgi:hypothetical protein